MKTKGDLAPPGPGKDVLFLSVLIALAVLVLTLWLADQTHRARDGSRVPWPEAQPHKP